MTRRNREEYGTNGIDVQLYREDNRWSCDGSPSKFTLFTKLDRKSSQSTLVKENGILKVKHETSYSTYVHDFWSGVVFLIRLSSSWNLQYPSPFPSSFSSYTPPAAISS
jgi:hypothetical protein